MNFLILIIGLQGTGKSTLAREMVKRLKAISISTEAIRQALFESAQLPGQDLDFTDHELKISYRAINHFVELMSDLPVNIVVDGVFRYEAQRQSLLALAAGRRVVKLLLQCDESVVEQRLLQRQACGILPPGGINAHRKTILQFEAPSTDYILLDTTKLSPQQIYQYLADCRLLTS